MPSLFSLPLPTYQQPLNKSKSQQLRSKKRRRKGKAIDADGLQDALDDQEDSLQYLLEAQPPASSQNLEYSAVLTPEARTQYRVAGQPFDKEPPPLPFPHSTTKKDKSKVLGTEVTGQRPSPPSTLHLQHLSTITAILHRCLAEQDYTRASRAFGLLMRDSLGGLQIDIRNEGLWGIGAEILLKAGSGHDCPLGNTAADDRAAQQEPLFTREGFDRARRYYEGLIVQYPYRKQQAASINALDFYQALFGLWVYVVHEEVKMEVKFNPASEEACLLRELKQAQEVAEHMDTCMSRIPFNDDLELIRLRGMVALWITDLAESCSGGGTLQSDAMSMDGAQVSDIASVLSQVTLQELPESGSKRELQLVALQARRLAQKMFSRLPDNGDRSTEPLRDHAP